MTTITFNSLELVQELRAAGLEQSQAEGIVNTIIKAQNELVTHNDLERLSLSLDNKLEATKVDIIKWNIGSIIAAAGLATAVVKLLH